MEKIQSLAFCQKTKFILVLILATFFLKGVFLTAIFPIFEGQDEARHYNTIQHLLQPKSVEKNDPREITKNNKIFADYNFSEEILKAGTAAGLDSLRSADYNKIEYSDSYDGQNEAEINKHGWLPYNFWTYPDMVSNTQFYHKVSSLIEKFFSNQSILVRFYLIRIFSVLLGTAVVLFSYLIAKAIGFSAKHSLILAAIISFQPRLSIYFTNINYDTLFVLLFIVFTYAAVLALKNGLNWKNLILLIASIALGIMTKQTTMVLLVAFAILMFFFVYKKIERMSKNVKLFSFVVFLLALGFLLVFLAKNIPSGNYEMENILSSTGKYLSKTLTLNHLTSPSESYWGALGWTNSWVVENFIKIIWAIQFFAAIGIGIFLFSKKERPDFLPEKKYIVFLLMMIALLQLGIRFADWSLFQALGRIETGLPGRYFLPNITAHIILVFVGIGALVKKKIFFERSLLVGLVLMMALTLYLISNVIIYRYYL